MFPITASVVAGGRERARRCLALAAALVAAVGLSDTAAGNGAPQVSVAETDGVYTVTATFTVAEPVHVARAVLTDYEQIPRYMPDVRSSTVLERGPNRVVIAQEAVARFMLFSRRIHLVLEVEETASTIAFRDRDGRHFERYEGAWRLAEQDGTARIVYELTAKPAFRVPGFVLKRLLSKDATNMIDRLRAEIARRAGGA